MLPYIECVRLAGIPAAPIGSMKLKCLGQDCKEVSHLYTGQVFALNCLIKFLKIKQRVMMMLKLTPILAQPR